MGITCITGNTAHTLTLLVDVRAGMQGMCPINVSVCFRVLFAVWLSSPRDLIAVNVIDPTRYLLSDNTATQTDNTTLCYLSLKLALEL